MTGPTAAVASTAAAAAASEAEAEAVAAAGVTVLVAPAGPDARRTVRALLLDAAADTLGVPRAGLRIAREPGGRPVLAGTGPPTGAGRPLHVALSHGRDTVAAALTRLGPVGVDVERIRPLPTTGLARRWFDPAEAEWLERQPGPERPTAFLRLWVQKEALGKALGTGLRDGGMRRRVLPPGTPPAGLLAPLPTRPDLALCLPPAPPGLCLAVAVWSPGAAGAPVAPLS
ncbi:4'-phosphopantetheinyl transferase family protein [Kitasatospora cineracea]|uniref:4'-phosphopantetheinyl transferase family protein n=1 Tax=Kitasatospora cineracea TaxID=88074 RepID=UPI0038304FB7